MIKTFHSQQGFARAVLTIGLVTALIGALCFIFWQNFLDNDPVSQMESKSSESIDAKKDKEPSIGVNKAGYLVVEPFSIRAKIPSALADTEIEYSTEGDTLYLVTSRVKKILEECKYEDSAGASIKASTALYRSQSKERFKGIDAPVLFREAKYGAYYYGNAGWVPLQTCTTNQFKLQKEDAEALIEMFKDLEVIQEN